MPRPSIPATWALSHHLHPGRIKALFPEHADSFPTGPLLITPPVSWSLGFVIGTRHLLSPLSLPSPEQAFSYLMLLSPQSFPARFSYPSEPLHVAAKAIAVRPHRLLKPVSRHSSKYPSTPVRKPVSCVFAMSIHLTTRAASPGKACLYFVSW